MLCFSCNEQPKNNVFDLRKAKTHAKCRVSLFSQISTSPRREAIRIISHGRNVVSAENRKHSPCLYWIVLSVRHCMFFARSCKDHLLRPRAQCQLTLFILDRCNKRRLLHGIETEVDGMLMCCRVGGYSFIKLHLTDFSLSVLAFKKKSVLHNLIYE